MALSEKDFKWIETYVRTGNGSEASRSIGISEASCSGHASKTLKRPEIYRVVRQKRAEMISKINITKDVLIQRLKEIAFTQLTDLVSIGKDKVEFENVEDIPKEFLSALKSAKGSITNSGKRSLAIETHDPLRAIEMIAKLGGLVEDPNESKNTINMNYYLTPKNEK